MRSWALWSRRQTLPFSDPGMARLGDLVGLCPGVGGEPFRQRLRSSFPELSVRHFLDR